MIACRPHARIASCALLAYFFVTAGAPSSSGQTPAPSDNTTVEINRLLDIYKANGNDKSFLESDTQYSKFLYFAYAQTQASAVKAVMANAEEQRMDKQAAAPAGSGASTSAVSNGSVPWLFGFAVEHGALTQSVDNNIITLRGNVANIAKAIETKDYVASYRKYQENNAVNLLSQVSFSVSFVAKQNGSTTNNTQSTVAGYSAHVDLYNHRDPRDRRYIRDWAEVAQHGLTQLATTVGTLHDLLTREHAAALQGWQERADATLKALTSTSSDDDMRAAIKKIAQDYVDTFSQLGDVRAASESVSKALQEYASQKGKVIDKIESSPIFSVEYTNTRQSVTTSLPLSLNASLSTASPLPDLSSINLIAGLPFAGRSQATLNASTTLFNSLPTSSSGSIRDWQLAGQIDIPLPEIPQIGKSTITFSGLFLSLLQQPLGQPLLVNGVAESRTGNIGLFQAKFSIPIKGAGVKIPISLTAANRTELIKETDVRGTIGITFDLDSIFAKTSTSQ